DLGALASGKVRFPEPLKIAAESNS
ncbi:MAG: hypothetical protein V7604_4277, partial [Hyphomicrobiales bacterium]